MLKTMLALGALMVPLLLAAPHPAAMEQDALMGRYAFNWKMAPLPKACSKIEKTLLSTLRSKAYACDLKERSNSASGETFVQCAKTVGTSEYLIFKTAKSCEKERETQEANGD